MLKIFAKYLPKCLRNSEIFRNFATRNKSSYNCIIPLIFKPFKTCKIMNKTFKKILQILSYIINLLLGGGKDAKNKFRK